MSISELNLAPGNWVYTNCADLPSEKGCQLVIMGPADQREDLLDAAVAHAVKAHGHEDTPEVRQVLDGVIKSIDM